MEVRIISKTGWVKKECCTVYKANRKIRKIYQCWSKSLIPNWLIGIVQGLIEVMK